MARLLTCALAADVAAQGPQSVCLTIQWRETVPVDRAGVGRILPHNPGNEGFL